MCWVLGQMLLVLDLDETLLYATRSPLPEREPDFRAGDYAVYKRPGVDAFLARCFERFEVMVWTSSSGSYAAQVVAKLFAEVGRPVRVWARGKCAQRFAPERQDFDYIKDFRRLKRLGYPLTQIIGVDDSPEKYARNYGNLVRVSPFEGELNDDELGLLWPYLLWLSQQPDVRAIEKRGWRLRMEAAGAP